MAYENQDFITHREYIGSPPACGGVRIAHLFSFLCCVGFTLSFFFLFMLYVNVNFMYISQV